MIINSQKDVSRRMDIFRNENDIDETQNDWINKMKLLEIVIQIPFKHNQSLPKKIHNEGLCYIQDQI